MNPDVDLAVVTRVVNVGVRLLNARIITLLCLLLTCALFGWAVYDPSPYRLAGAGLFSLFALAVIRMTKEARHETLSGD